MIILRSPADLNKARLPPNLLAAAGTVLNAIQAAHSTAYNPDDDGYLMVVTPADSDATLSKKLGQRWENAQFEGVAYDRKTSTWHAVILQGNQFAISVLIEDADWLESGIRRRMQSETDSKGGVHGR